MSAAPREARLPLADGPGEGEVRMIEVGRHRIGVFRSGGALHALADRCPHRGAPLCSAGVLATSIEAHDGRLELGPPSAIVRCPWHKWDFDLATGQCIVDARLRVRRYDVRVEDGEIVVSLGAAR
jgi:nitrite reductase/ring-hydroxylating ferredoxin subunit